MQLSAFVGADTLAWVNRHLDVGERIVRVDALHGGITAVVRTLTVDSLGGGTRQLVLKSYDRSMCHAEDSLHRESSALTSLAGTGILSPRLVAVDSGGQLCELPSLLMTWLPGRPILTDDGVRTRLILLARELVAIHALRGMSRPGQYRVLTTAETVVIPEDADAAVWAAAIDVIRAPAPRYEGRFLHRDYQPGNVLFDEATDGSTRITGVVDWAGTSWGPADLDVAHCATNLALLHGPEWGIRFTAAYGEAGGVRAATEDDRRYWQVRDALACSEEVDQWAAPWREAGRFDLTERVVRDRLDAYLSILMADQSF